MQMQKVLWIEPPSLSPNFQKLIHHYLRKCGCNVFDFTFKSLTKGMLIKRTKTKWIANPETEQTFKDSVARLNPKFIVCNDRAALSYLTGKYTSLALCRGGIYKYEIAGKLIPVLVIDELSKIHYVKHAGWVLVQDLQKLNRWLTGKCRPEARFSYTVCESEAQVSQFLKVANASVAIAIDIETTAIWISCIGYTCMLADGKVQTYVIPFIDPTKEGGRFWQTDEEEIRIWDLIRIAHLSPAVKIMQNGSYDSTYFIVYKIPLRNYLADTLHGWHSIWVEAPKRLDFITSIAMDGYQYWKDEGKEDAKDDLQGGRIPKTLNGIQNYWRYNALDCHNTLHSWIFILTLLQKPSLQWAKENYACEFKQQMGPAFAMSMRGVFCNARLQDHYITDMAESAYKAKQELLIAADNPEYNPNSPIQYREMLYDIFKLKPYGKKGKVTDAKILAMIKDQNIWASWFIEKTWECKKPANNASKYARAKVVLNDRFLYKMSAAGTETGRYGSKGHDLWVGTNVQNVPYAMRPMLEADKGYILFDIDYAQSDAYFTAFDLAEERFIETMLSDKDTHCLHAAFFFKLSYDVLAAAHSKKEDWCSHNQTGIRSVTKRVVYGANYEMQGPTLLTTMTRGPVISAAKQLGYTDAHLWNDRKLSNLCQAFLDKYFQMYPGLKPALHEKMAQARLDGNLYKCAFGKTRLFFGKFSDKAVQRQFAAFIGQGGTAGNINKALENIYYSDLEKHGVQLLFQVHDSIVGQVPEDKLYLIGEIQDAMANECELQGRRFTVPTSADVGLGWGKRLLPWSADLKLADIKKHDANWWKGFYDE